MSQDPQQVDEYFQRYADDVADVLRGLGGRWGGEEQLDNDYPEDENRKRFFIGYAFADGEKRAHVYADFWYGPTGNVVESREGKALSIELRPVDYLCARIDIDFISDYNAEDFAIQSDQTVHSAQELKDRLNLMWNHNYWKLNHEFIEENAALYNQYATMERFFKACLSPVSTILKKIGEAWGAEEQTDNTPDPEDKGGTGALGGMLSGLVSGKPGKKRYFIAYTMPRFDLDDKGKARIGKGSIALELWQGKKGTIQKAANGRRLVLDRKPDTHIGIAFPLQQPVMVVEGIQGAVAKSPKELQALLARLWKENAFGLNS